MAEHGKHGGRIVALLAFLLALLIAAPAAQAAEFGVGSSSLTTSTSQAGAHADLSTSFALRDDALGNPIGSIKDVRIELPAGMVGNAAAIEKCSIRSFQTAACQPGAQVGTFGIALVPCHGYTTPLTAVAPVGATELQVESTEGLCEEEESGGNVITIGSGPTAEQARIVRVPATDSVELLEPLQNEHAAGEAVTHIGKAVEGPLPLFNLTPFPGHVATFGSFLLGITFLVQVDIDGDGNLVAKIEDLSTRLNPSGGSMSLWGFPGDPKHDPERCNELLFKCGLSVAQETPFLTQPTECSGQAPTAHLEMESWQGDKATATLTQPPLTGCGQLTIDPSLEVRPETTEADSPSGFEVGITVPQRSEPRGLGTPPLKDIALTLPPGVSLSPAFANGLGTCSETQAAAGQCPNASRIGSAEVVSPLLEEPLKGSVYFGTPTASVKYPLLVRVASSRAAINFSGRAVLDPQTGQVSAVFENAPRLPFREMRLTLFGGSSAAFDNPQACGTATSSVAVTAYGGASAKPTSSYTVDGRCGTAFSPGFVAGTKVAKAAAFSPFSMTLTRADGEPNLGSFSAQLPQGLTGLLRSVTQCGEPQAASGNCPQSSVVGSATIGAGAGAAPLYLSGPAYLTGPYGGAQFGLDVLVHAAAGPIDLGDVLVRSRLYIDQKTLALKIVSDPLPQIIGGVPLRTRSVHVTLDKPDFVLNPSTCGRAAITGTAVSTSGESRALSTPFSVLGCNGLRFAPQVSASTGPGGSRAGQGASLQMRIAPGGVTKAPLGSLAIVLPKPLRARLTTIQHSCLPGGASLDAVCADDSVVGTASIVTPALSQALAGRAYLVAHGPGKKPTLALLLHGGGLTQQLEGELTISKTHVIEATFEDLPDVPIDEMNLSLPRSSHSLLGAVSRLCGNPLKLAYTMTDQSGHALKASSGVAVKGCARKRRK